MHSKCRHKIYKKSHLSWLKLANFCTVENMSFVNSSVEQSVAGITDSTAEKRLKCKENGVSSPGNAQGSHLEGLPSWDPSRVVQFMG